MKPNDLIPIGALAARTGLSISSIRFYEAKGLISPLRNNGGQRRFFRSDIRRLSFIVIAQQVGLSIKEIKSQLETLPKERTPTQRDWTKISIAMRDGLNERIDLLTRLRDNLDGCIGCGCLSLRKCKLYNPEDRASIKGSGPQRILRGQ